MKTTFDDYWLGEALKRLTSAAWRHGLEPGSPDERAARENVHRHYDLGNDFYRLWLDREMVYTCAYFPSPDDTLEDAQIAKMDLVCRKLRLKAGERVVEAGCGWGALALHMARHYGVRVRAYNLSTEQIAWARARAERERIAATEEVKRQNLVRKELAWLRRGAPARTSKPKFRLDAASALIDDEPPPRDRLELQRFATQRLGKDVIDVEDVDLRRGDRVLLSHATWRLGPGDRVGIVGVNGAGKSSVLALLDGSLVPGAGRVKLGRTVALQHLTQALDDLDPQARVLETVEAVVIGTGEAQNV